MIFNAERAAKVRRFCKDPSIGMTLQERRQWLETEAGLWWRYYTTDDPAAHKAVSDKLYQLTEHENEQVWRNTVNHSLSLFLDEPDISTREAMQLRWAEIELCKRGMRPPRYMGVAKCVRHGQTLVPKELHGQTVIGCDYCEFWRSE